VDCGADEIIRVCGQIGRRYRNSEWRSNLNVGIVPGHCQTLREKIRLAVKARIRTPHNVRGNLETALFIVFLLSMTVSIPEKQEPEQQQRQS
jgi:hypothetical protein